MSPKPYLYCVPKATNVAFVAKTTSVAFGAEKTPNVDFGVEEFQFPQDHKS